MRAHRADYDALVTARLLRLAEDAGLTTLGELTGDAAAPQQLAEPERLF